MFTFIVTELSNTPVRSVNDELRSPVMQAELHVNLAWSIFNSYVSPRSWVEQRMSSTIRQQDPANVHNQSLRCHKYFKVIFITNYLIRDETWKRTNFARTSLKTLVKDKSQLENDVHCNDVLFPPRRLHICSNIFLIICPWKRLNK